MLIKQLMELYELIDRSDANGYSVKEFLENTYGAKDITVRTIQGNPGSTDFIRIRISGTRGKSQGMNAPTIGLLGRLGGLGARPEVIGMVSDGDGALVALTIAAKLLDMQQKGDFIEGDVVVCTHICPDAPTQPHKPVPFMGSPVEMSVVNQAEVDDELDAILSCDTTKGNRIINTRGFAISPTVKEGYILKVSDDLLDIMQITTGRMPYVFALSTQDITPYGNDLFHINSILQPATATKAPVVGVAITTEVPVPGSASGASHFVDMELAARFMLEVAKAFGRGQCQFFDEEEYKKIVTKYGSMNHLQTLGK
ncbi:DUF1177 domain-containing protein [Desulfosporosinus metallidurans]|uniref:DUF1177 domain-containing protein n=1 Tax=Desulfosporosinus metallidurans TaxID=1888891 RepID=A0A1Q8QXL2_9FIRM|nr:DUF1177 domain-containing protein [Desulfosporosinus metallidurans]OLN31980.1 hypothetical protein DSOL_2073 [Desulfosporosinus metallidurans]